jgi:hypothetical protein
MDIKSDRMYMISFSYAGGYPQFPDYKQWHFTREAALAEVERVKRLWGRDPTNPGGVVPLLYAPGSEQAMRV